MNRLFALLMLLLVPFEANAGKPVYRFVEGEDATSAHYYFLYSDGESINRVRWVWNGGATNQPPVTEYVIEPGALKVTKSVGARKVIPALEAGKEPPLEVTESYTVSLLDGPRRLKLADGELTPTQRGDIVSLLSILARERTR